MSDSTIAAWKSTDLAQAYLTSVRGAVPLADEQIEIMLRLINGLGRPVRTFLDLGCGDGILAAAVLGQHPQARGVLLDFSEPMLEAARSRLQQFALQLSFVLMDYGEPSWAASVAEMAPFDVIVSGYSIHHQPDERKRELYAELFDLLQPGGIFINIEHVASPTTWTAELFDKYFIDALYAYHLNQGGTKSRVQVAQEFYHRPDKGANLLAPVELQCRWLREIGFQDVDCYLKVFELAVFGGRRPDCGPMS